MFLNSSIINSLPKGEGEFLKQILDVTDLFIQVTGSDDKLLQLPQHLRGIKSVPACCHSIALAISMLVPGMRVVHGIYRGLVEGEGEENGQLILRRCAHSWNVTPHGTIIDSYHVGVHSGGPVIVASHGQHRDFGAGHYCELPEVVTKLPMFKHYSIACTIVDVINFAREQ